jgi:uncharacterized protein
MLNTIEKYFSRRSAGRLVAESFLRYGMSVDSKGAIFCGPFEMAPAKIGRALGIDRRVVIAVAAQIASHEDLLSIFGKLQPRAYIGDCAKKLGFDSIEISADAHAAGIVESVAKIFSDNKIMIRQIIADDPDLFPEPKLNIVADGRLSAKVIGQIRKLESAEKIAIK